MSRIQSLFMEQQESKEFRRYLAPEVTLPPDFNAWMKAVEKDKDYLAKREKELDDELGKDRLF